MATVTTLNSLSRVGDVADPPTAEKMRHQVCSDGLALFDGAYDVEAMLAVAGRMMHVTAHPDSDDRRVTTIVELGPAADQPNAGGFSRRELVAHTDRSGIPDPPGRALAALAILTGLAAAAAGCSRTATTQPAPLPPRQHRLRGLRLQRSRRHQPSVGADRQR